MELRVKHGENIDFWNQAILVQTRRSLFAQAQDFQLLGHEDHTDRAVENSLPRINPSFFQKPDGLSTLERGLMVESLVQESLTPNLINNHMSNMQKIQRKIQGKGKEMQRICRKSITIINQRLIISNLAYSFPICFLLYFLQYMLFCCFILVNPCRVVVWGLVDVISHGFD